MFRWSSHVSWLNQTEDSSCTNGSKRHCRTIWERDRPTWERWSPRWRCRTGRQWCPAQREGWGAVCKHPARQNTSRSALQSTSCQRRTTVQAAVWMFSSQVCIIPNTSRSNSHFKKADGFKSSSIPNLNGFYRPHPWSQKIFHSGILSNLLFLPTAHMTGTVLQRNTISMFGRSTKTTRHPSPDQVNGLVFMHHAIVGPFFVEELMEHMTGAS